MLLDGKTGKLLAMRLPLRSSIPCRMNYDDVRDILVEQDHELPEKYQDIVPCWKPWQNSARYSRSAGKNGIHRHRLPEQKVILDEKHPI